MEATLVNLIHTFAFLFEDPHKHPSHIWEPVLHIITFYHVTMVLGAKVHDPFCEVHVPRLKNLSSFLLLLCLCAICIFSNALSPPTYKCTEDSKSNVYVAFIHLLEYDLNSLTSMERDQRVRMRNLAWELIQYVCDNYMFMHMELTQEFEPYQQVVVPLLASIVVSICGIHQRGFDSADRYYDEDTLALQVSAPLKKEPAIMEELVRIHDKPLGPIIPSYPFLLKITKRKVPSDKCTVIRDEHKFSI